MSSGKCSIAAGLAHNFISATLHTAVTKRSSPTKHSALSAVANLSLCIVGLQGFLKAASVNQGASTSRPRRRVAHPSTYRASLLSPTTTMSHLRQAAARLSRPVFRTQIISRPSTATRHFSTTPRILASTTAAKTGDHASEHADHGHGHESHYDPPGGWLWGIRPGEKAEREGWEIPFYVMCAGYVVAVIAYSMKEDTS